MSSAPPGGTDEVLPRSFFTEPVLDVAAALVGSRLRLRDPAGVIEIRITETEAYRGADDPASHAYRRRTARNEVMYGAPGHAYVYFSYGMHWCLNLVCGPPGRAEAVLVRAGEVLTGADVVAARRPGVAPRQWCRGPALLMRSLGLDGATNGADLCAPGAALAVLPPLGAPVTVRSGPRVGITAGVDLPWRFWDPTSASVTTWRAGGPRRAAGTAPTGAPRPG